MIARHLETRELERMLAGPAWDDSGLLLVDESGRGVHPNRLRRRFAKLVAAAGLPKIGVHHCRHSYATAALASDQPVKLISERLGHANTGITLDRYGHVLPRQDAALATAVAILIDGDD